MKLSIDNQKNTNALLKNLETQIDQIEKQFANQQSCAFNVNPQTNLKGHCNAITIGKVKIVIVQDSQGT